MIPQTIINSMRKLGAMRVKNLDYDNNLRLEIDFKKIEEYFPKFLDELVRHTLGTVDLDLYDQGYIAYLVRDDGMLQWKPTRKLSEVIRDSTKNSSVLQ